MISPLDTRYAKKLDMVTKWFTDSAHTRACFDIEVDYWFFIKLLLYPEKNLRESLPTITDVNYKSISAYEDVCKHDIKAVEYAVRDYVLEHRLGHPELVHYGLTSQDIVSFSWNYRMKQFLADDLIPMLRVLIIKIEDIDGETCTPMYCRTHGQKGNITTMSKEMEKYGTRILRELEKLENMRWYCKFSGSTGDFSTLEILHPDMMMRERLEEFIMQNYGIHINDCSTQTDNWYSLCEVFTFLNNISNILIDLCRDLWIYHMNGDINYTQIDKKQVGSSVMPQKINPIDIENAEGNLEMCNMWFQFLTGKLSKSRLQRDLSDSVVMRHVGIPISNFVLAVQNVISASENITVNNIKDIDYAVFSELIQTKLRSMGEENAYEKVKDLFRTGRNVTRGEFERSLAVLFKDGIPKDITDYVRTVIHG